MTLSAIDSSVGSILYFTKEGDEEIPLQEKIAKIAEDIFEPKSREEARLILGFNPKNSRGKSIIKEISSGKEQLLEMLRRHSLATKDGQWARFQIAKRVAAKDGWGTSKNIQQYGFDAKTEVGLKILFEIAKIAAADGGGGTSECIKNYGFDPTTKEGQKCLFEIAKIAAAQNGYGTSDSIENYGFDPKTDDGKRMLFEIAKIAAAKDGGGTSEFIQNYGFDKGTKDGQEMLFEIAKIAAAESGGATSLYIENYGFDKGTEEGQNRLFEIAKIAAANGEGTSSCIQNYGFQNMPGGQKKLFEIAKIAASKYGKRTSESIQNYSFDAKTEEGQKCLFKIAKVAAAQDAGAGVYIQQYGFNRETKDGQKKLFKIAKISADKNGWRTSENIESYGFDPKTKIGQKYLYKIAKVAVAQHGETSDYIRNYGFDESTEKGQKYLFKIAKIAAAKHGGGISLRIKNYGFDARTEVGQKKLFEIAKVAAAQDGWKTSVFIQNYGFDLKTEIGKMMLFEIAKIAASQNGGRTSQFIWCYGFDWMTKEGQQMRFEIAKIAAIESGGGTSVNIYEYGFDAKTEDGQKALLEILQISAQGNLYLAPELVRNYSIKDEQALRDPLIELILRKHDSQDIDSPLEEWLNRLVVGFPYIEIFTDKIPKLPYLYLPFPKKLFEILKADKKTIEWVEKCQTTTKGLYHLQRFVDWFTFLGLFQFVVKDVDLFNGKSLWLLEEIEKRDPRLRKALTEELFLASRMGRLEFLELGIETKERPLRLIRLIFSNYPKEAEEYCKRALQFFSEPKKRIALKEGGRQKLLLETLLLISGTSLEPQHKGQLVEHFAKVSLEEMPEVASLIKDIILFGGENDLKEQLTMNTLKTTLEKHFSATCQLHVEGFDSKYETTIGTWSEKSAISTYVAGLKSLNDQGEAISLFGKFLTTVLENTFEDERKALDGNPHLKWIQENYPDVYAKWNVPIELDSSEMAVEEEKTSVKDKIHAQLKMAIDNQHLGVDQEVAYPYFIACMKKHVLADEAFRQLENKLSDDGISNEERSSLTVEKALLQLVLGEDKETIKKALEALKSRDLKNEVFKEDLKACENLLKEGFKRKGLQTIDSTDSNHFLLMGTEVLGSCQRIGGDPKLNRGLLGYMLDGKHRLFLVLDETGKIVARSVARLLVDEKDQPVLFLERLYVADNNPKYAPLIEKLARKKSKEMQVPLLISQEDPRGKGCRTYPSKIKALVGKVPFEYVDALRGMQCAPYEIKGVFVREYS